MWSQEISTAPIVLAVLMVMVCRVMAAPVSEQEPEPEVETHDEREARDTEEVNKRSSQLSSTDQTEADLTDYGDQGTDNSDISREEDAEGEEEEEEVSIEQQQPCIPEVEGQRCTFDICGDPAGIIRNCCQEFCGIGGGVPVPSPSTLLFMKVQDW